MNHARDLIALDFFAVPTATFRVLFVLIVLSHGRRRLVHFNVTEHPTAEWTARQLIEACGQDESPRHLIRDRDQVYGERFSRQARLLDIREAVIAPRSPWQNAYAERVIGSIRRECLDHGVPRMPNREGRQCCRRDEGRPLGVGVQDQAPNPLTLRWSRASVVNGEAKGALERVRYGSGRRTRVNR